LEHRELEHPIKEIMGKVGSVLFGAAVFLIAGYLVLCWAFVKRSELLNSECTSLLDESLGGKIVSYAGR
jgi:hypothetical protein